VSNLTESTRELIDKTWRSAITYQMPLFTRLSERGQMIPGGLKYEQIVEIADSESLVQTYGPNDGLAGGTADIMDKPSWVATYMTVPVEESVDERIMNAPKSDAQLVSLRDKIAKSALRSLKQVMNKYAYGVSGDNTIDSRHTNLQGLCSALVEDKQYGSLTRTGSTVNEWWQSADYAAWDVAAAINKTNIDEWLDAVMEYADSPQDLLVLMGPTLYRRLKAQFEASNSYTPKATVAKQGFTSMEYNGVEIAKDWSLDRMTDTSVTDYTGTNVGLSGVGSAAGTSFVFVLDLSTWHLRYYQDADTGPFEMTEFFAQDQIIGGVEKKLARIKWKGQLTCDMPNRNLVRSNVS